jgi:protoporphyrinogen oxidase
MEKYDTAIIGGGISGLFIAYKLSQSGKKVIVIEKEKNLGGMLRSVKVNDFYIEEFYHHIFSENKLTINLIEELGLKDKLKWDEASTSFYYNGKFYNLTQPLDLLSFGPLNFYEKTKLALFLLSIKILKAPGRFDNISAEEFIVKRTGNSVYRKFFKPLLSAKYSKNLDKISATWFIERINLRNNRGYKGEILGYLEGGFHQILDKLQEKIILNKGEIILGADVKKIHCSDNKAVYLELKNKKIRADNFVSTISGPALEKICPFNEDYRERLKQLVNQGTICIIAGLNRKISRFYWTNLIDETIPFRALIEHTNFQPYSTYNCHLVYLASYPEQNSPIWKMSEEEIFKNYLEALKKISGIGDSDVQWYRVIKEENAGLIYTKGSLKKILPTKTPVENLFIAGMLNSYPDRNLEQSLKLSNKLLGEIK